MSVKINTKKSSTLHEVRDSEKLYKIAIESLSAMFYVQRMKPDYKILYISPAFESVGYSPEEWYQDPKMFRKITHPEDLKSILEKNKELKKNAGTESDYEYRILTKNGEIRWWQDRGKLIKGENGEPDIWLGIIHDITEKKNAELALYEGEKDFRNFIENAQDIIYRHDLKGNLISINKAAEKITGFTREESLLQNWEEFVAPEYQNKVKEAITRQIAGEPPQNYEIDLIKKDGTRVSVEVGSRLIFKNGKPVGVEGITRDVTERKLLKEERDRFYNLSYDMLAKIDFKGCLLQINPAWKRILGYEKREVLNNSIVSLVHPDDISNSLIYAEKLLNGEAVTFECRMKCKDDSYRWFEWGSIPVVDEKVSYAVGRDITERKESEKKLEHNALHDSLTGLPNREHFRKHLELAVERSNIETSFKFAVLFIDLDRFKVVNDSLGHFVGDELLIAISKKIKTCLRPSDVIARLGGDEFTILITIKNEADAIRVANRIQERISVPFHIESYEVFTSASVGIIISDQNRRNAEEYLRDADTAMYRAKDQGKARYEIYDRQMHTRSINILQVETDLRRAIEHKEFRVFYQPIIDLQSGELCEFEALIRWQHPKQGLVFPDHFISIAEETGLIVPIGSWVIEESCRQVLEWERKFDLPLKISVNLSAKQLTHPFLVSKIQKVLEDFNLLPSRLKLEVTESTVMDNTEAALKTIRDLNLIGVRLSTDDFGTGYSSLSYLHLFPFERIKIDRSFISKMDTDIKSEAIVRSILMLGQNLEIDIVAEGIENEEQLWQLRTLGCKFGQGYLFSKPVNAVEVEKLFVEGLPIDFSKIEMPFAFADMDPGSSVTLGKVQ
jgi:diguanylate cyclase (GGDEF)-like protein/PAS domain S-box-containing protein